MRVSKEGKLWDIYDYILHLEDKTERHESDKKEIFDLMYTISLANVDDRLVDAINRVAELSEAEE